MEKVRVRMVFEGQHILSEAQKKEGLKKSWILFKPKHLKTISDLADYLLRIFHLHHSSPHGLVLSMDGFVLPPFESTAVFKDNDVVCVRRKREASSELITLDGGADALDAVQIVKQPVQTGLKLLANEEFYQEKGSRDSESEEDDHEKGLEQTPDVNKSSKKRNASKKLQGSKRKKSKISTAEETPVVFEDVQNVCEVKSGRSSRDRSLLKKDKSSNVQGNQEKWRTPELGETSNCISKCVPDAKRFSQLQENGKGNVDVSSTPVGTKKFPSRSARRKKAKRQWLREQAKIEKMELHQKQLNSKVILQSADKDGQILSDEHQQPDPVSQGKDNKRLSDGYQQPGPNGDADDDVVPVVIRPGHIRFEPLVDDIQTVQQNQTPLETYQWNGITSKKKGQKWGRDKAAFSKKSIYENFDQFSEMPSIEKEISIAKDMEFEKLPPYISLPKEGDVIAYRLIELTSSWTPEPSSFRVGKISWYDSDTNKILLAPVPEYPLAFEKKTDENVSALQSETLYGEDGSLRIDFSLLLDVRIIKHGEKVNEVHVGDQDVVTNFNEVHVGGHDYVTNVNEVHLGDQDAVMNFNVHVGDRDVVMNLGDDRKHGKAHAPAQGNGEVRLGDQDAVSNVRDNSNKEKSPAHTQENGKLNAWEEINLALSAKKAELSHVDDQSAKERSKQSSGHRLSYKALRSSALGPTMAFLRSENGL
ncbi:hypothetical protein AB3S75_038405 [Citrus x aurantiifolia]